MELFRRVVLEMVGELESWVELSASLCNDRLSEDERARLITSAVSRNNELWSSARGLAPNLLPTLRMVHAPQVVPYRDRSFQSYTDVVAWLAWGQRAAIVVSGMDVWGENQIVMPMLLDAPRVFDTANQWSFSIAHNHRPLSKARREWQRLRTLIRQEFLAASRNPPANDVELSSADGPIPPREFRCGGKHARLSKLTYRLVAALWKYERHVASARKLVMEIWDDQEKESSALKSAINRANAQLLLGEVPVTISRDGDYVKLTIDRP